LVRNGLATVRLQELLEARPGGRLLISAFILVTLAAVCITNLPESRLRREAMKAAEPFLGATGVDQNWRVFAPDPRQTSLRLEARVRYADGSSAVWRPPAGGDLVGAYWDYRWAKWLENVTQDANRKVLWKPAALFIVRQMRGLGKRPRQVTLTRRWQDLRAPGAPGPDLRGWRSYDFYTLRLPA
jgi:hypothetical protein